MKNFIEKLVKRKESISDNNDKCYVSFYYRLSYLENYYDFNEWLQFADLWPLKMVWYVMEVLNGQIMVIKG